MEAAMGAERERRIVVLGAGITGLTAAWRLAAAFGERVLLLEKEGQVGGLAATVGCGEWRFDLGSHRIHPEFGPDALGLIEELLGGDLLRRERRGIILVGGRYLRYPPSALDVMTSFGPRKFLELAAGYAAARLARLRGANPGESFESYAIHEVGEGLYRLFYRPYAAKLWGADPAQLSKEPAAMRGPRFAVHASLDTVRRHLLGQGKPYFYPRRGIGQLAGSLAARFQAAGGELRCAAWPCAVELDGDRSIRALEVAEADGRRRVEAELVVSTIPLRALLPLLPPALGSSSAGLDLEWRHLRVLHLVTRGRTLRDTETFYFPEASTFLGRVSEAHRYSPDLNRCPGTVALTVEMPCSFGDALWEIDDDELARACLEELHRLQILASDGAPQVSGHRLRDVYPVYTMGWRQRFQALYDRLESVSNLFLVGRGPLFLQCNLDHCMQMGQEVARFLEEEDRRRAIEHRASPRGAAVTSRPRSRAAWRAIARRFFIYSVRE